MSATRTLASYLSRLVYEDLPPEVVDKGKLAIMDALGNAIGGYPLSTSNIFLDLAKELGGGRGQATLIGDGTKVSVPLAAFANGALSNMLDYSDFLANKSGRNGAYAGAVAVPAALAAGEARGISGQELITSVVAGYECAARVVHSMDKSDEQAEKVKGQTVSVFASAGAAGRALGLDEDGLLSTLGMTGMYTPVPSGYRWLGEEGLTPKADIKQGWAWMCMTGTFAAVSAQKGLTMVQENNILDGERGLWRMVGMDISHEEQLTAGLGETYHILKFASKAYPGCMTTHTPIIGVSGLLKKNNIDLADIEGIEVVTNWSGSIGFDVPEPNSVADMEFSMPYQVAAALLAGGKGPDWYSERTARSQEVADMAKRVVLSFDEESEQFFRETNQRMSKITVQTKGGQRYSTRVDRAGVVQDAEELRDKFVTTTSQVIDKSQVDKILDAIDSLETMEEVSELVDLLYIPAPMASKKG